MLYGGLLGIVSVATDRVWFVVVGMVAFALGAWYLGTHIPHVHDRVEAWLHPLNPKLYNANGGSFQLANSMFAQAAGGVFGPGFGEATPTVTPTHPVPSLPA